VEEADADKRASLLHNGINYSVKSFIAQAMENILFLHQQFKFLGKVLKEVDF
jgi:hypothetical protein